MQRLIQEEKKVIDEVEPITEAFIDILSGKYKMMVHVHKEDDVIVFIQLAREFGIKVVASHCADVYRRAVFAALKYASIPIVYGPMDSFPYKTELRHKSWRNAEKLLASVIILSFYKEICFYSKTFVAIRPIKV